MPRFLKEKLQTEASKKGLKGKKADAYIYGTMNNLGAMHGSKETAKGERMQEKHDVDTEIHAYDWRAQRGRRAPMKMKVGK